MNWLRRLLGWKRARGVPAWLSDPSDDPLYWGGLNADRLRHRDLERSPSEIDAAVETEAGRESDGTRDQPDPSFGGAPSQGRR